MKVAIYPGSFNPFHQGHLDVLKKALKIFDKVIVAFGVNPEKADLAKGSSILFSEELKPYIEIHYFKGLLVDYIAEFAKEDIIISAVIRGLRNGSDLQYEMNMQYWNEDLGLSIPVIYFITDRKLCHISSSTIREVNKFKRN